MSARQKLRLILRTYVSLLTHDTQGCRIIAAEILQKTLQNLGCITGLQPLTTQLDGGQRGCQCSRTEQQCWPLSARRPGGGLTVSALHTTNARWDIVAKLRADSLESFDIVFSRIRLVEGIANTETSLLPSTHKL